MKILVTGATGYIGLNLVRRLSQKYTVRAMVRKTSKIDALTRLGVEVFVADFSVPESLSRALDNIEIVYHLAGALPNAGLKNKEAYFVNALAVQRLLEACKQTKTLKQFIHCSTAYLSWQHTPFTNEDTIVRPTTLYEHTKLAGENIVREAIGKISFPLTIVRPGFVYGGDGKGLLPMFTAIGHRQFFFVGNGNHLFELTHIDDLVDFFELILKNEKAFNQIFIVSEKSPRTFKEIVNLIADSLNVEPPKLKLLPFLFKLVVEAMAALKTFGIALPLSRDSYKTFTLSRAFNVNKAKQLLDYETKITPEKGLSELGQWYRENHWMESLNSYGH